MRKLPNLLAIVLLCVGVLLAKEQAVVRCTAGSPQWEGKAGKFKVVLDSSNPSGDCRLSILQNHKEVFSTQAKLLEVLARGTDLNMDTKPDLAFQTQPSGGCCWTLHLLTLEDSPKLIGEIENRLPFVYRAEAAYGAPGFLTQDGVLAGGFDGLSAGELTDLPSLVIGWDGTKALDLSSGNAREYGAAAAKLDTQLTAERIAAFRQSDGRVESSGPEAQPLRRIKAQVLGNVLASLYAGADGSAWTKLEEVWPASDASRIRKSLDDALATGLRSRLLQPRGIINGSCQAQALEPVFKVGGKVTPPRATYQPDPEYSEPARAQRLQGTLLLEALISAEGCIHELRLVRRLGLGLDENAIKAVLSWRFDPAKREGKPVAVRVNIEVNFSLGL